MNNMVLSINYNKKRFLIENLQELSKSEKFQLAEILPIIDDIRDINSSDAKFYITEYSECYLGIESLSGGKYSLGYTQGLDCLTIYEEIEDSMEYVNYIHGEVDEIIMDNSAINMIEGFIVEYETKNTINR